MSERDTIAKLSAWGEWSRTGGVNLRVRSALYAAEWRPAPDISDDEAMRIERIVTQLKRHSALLHEVIKLHFVCELGIREIAVRLHVTRDAAGKLYERAVGWVDCGINLSEVA